MPLSTILIRDFIAEMVTRPKFTALTDAGKLQRLNGLCRRISGWFNAAGKKDFEVSTVTGAALAGAAVLGIRSNTFVCDIDGSDIVFSSPIAGAYTLTIIETDGKSINAPLAEQTANGFKAYAGVEDGTAGAYVATPVQ